MNHARKLFFHKDPYDISKTAPFFLDAVRENVEFHRKNCAVYAAILRAQHFDSACLYSEADLHKIPALPTLYFKRNSLFSIADDRLTVRATSSGTKGLQSQVGFDRQSLFLGIMMMVRFFSYHRVISPIPTNYIILNYPPDDQGGPGAAKTSYGTTRFVPALHREYALKHNGADGALNIAGVEKALLRYAEQGFPVRFVGFPAYMYFLVRMLHEKGITLRLSRRSRILLGGGWKQFDDEEIDREAFYTLIGQTLGLGEESLSFSVRSNTRCLTVNAKTGTSTFLSTAACSSVMSRRCYRWQTGRKACSVLFRRLCGTCR